MMNSHLFRRFWGHFDPLNRDWYQRHPLDKVGNWRTVTLVTCLVYVIREDFMKRPCVKSVKSPSKRLSDWPDFRITHQHRENVDAVQPNLCLLYDTVRDAILTCARKPTWVSLIYRTETTTKKCNNRKTKSTKQICSEIAVNSLGNPCSESWRRKRKGCSGKDLQKRKVLSLEWKSEWVMEYQIIVSMTVGR